MFCCIWTTYLEQLTCQSARQGSQLHRIQKTTENIHVSDGLRRIVTFLINAPYKYSYLLTYLLTYLHTLDGDFMSRKISRLTLIEWEEDATEQPVRSHDPADRLNKRAVVSRDVSNCQVS